MSTTPRRRAYDALADAAAGPAVQARLARLAAATGDLAGARRLADAALAAATRDPDTASETLAWYHTLSGALAFQAGDVAGSSDAYALALEAWPGSAAGLAGLARATAATGDLAGAIPLYERAIAIVPRPETLAALGDLLELTGDTTEAEEQRAMALAVGGLAPDRQLAKYLADHGVDIRIARSSSPAGTCNRDTTPMRTTRSPGRSSPVACRRKRTPRCASLAPMAPRMR